MIERFNIAGAVNIGKTNMDEFAMGSSNETSYYGPVKNPWDIAAVPGGSSGGSACAVAARMAPAATGTDTGGSIRQPAALCGISGIKPTYGLVSRYGMVAFASSLDQGGPMAKSAEDLALMLNVMAGFDTRDSTSLQREAEDYARDLEKPLEGLRIGLPKEYFVKEIDDDVARAVEAAIAEYRKLGAKTVEVSLPNTKLSVPVYYVLAPAEASSNLSRFDGVRYGYRAPKYIDLDDMYRKSRAQGFGAEVKQLFYGSTNAECGASIPTGNRLAFPDAWRIQRVNVLIGHGFHFCKSTMNSTIPGLARHPAQNPQWPAFHPRMMRSAGISYRLSPDQFFRSTPG